MRTAEATKANGIWINKHLYISQYFKNLLTRWQTKGKASF